jgi:hypothetical protein
MRSLVETIRWEDDRNLYLRRAAGAFQLMAHMSGNDGAAQRHGQDHRRANWSAGALRRRVDLLDQTVGRDGRVDVLDRRLERDQR